MPSAVSARHYGEVRAMGPGKLDREKPYLNRSSLAEALYYRGLIATIFGEGMAGSQTFTYVPTDLVPLLPSHKTGYDLDALDIEPVAALPQPPNVRTSDTAVVVDLTSLVAYCQLPDVALLNGTLDAAQQKALKPYLLGSTSAARLSLMVALAAGLGIAAENQGLLKPVNSAARKWLDQSRSAQVRSLAEVGRERMVYNELWFTPGLKPEQAGWQNDPLLARQTVLTFLEMVPADGWWPVDTFISAVKENEPDFQRPAGDYDSWYIRDPQTGHYLRGFETWDRVDGAVLRFILTGPMHGLGLVDTADNGRACRLTAYGRAFSGIIDWPSPAGDGAPFSVKADGLCEIPRNTSRYDRFQLARFTEWIAAGDPYQYRISTAGLAQAAQQNIQAGNILTFLKRGTGDHVPDTIFNLIETWGQAGNESAVISQMTVLRVPSAELLETILATPALRRYLGAVLGPMAVAVRPGQWHDLSAALEANGGPAS